MDPSQQDIGRQILDVPFAEMVQAVGVAIAEAQLQLDLASVRIAQIMAGGTYKVPGEDEDAEPEVVGPVSIDLADKQFSLLELGFSPTFYQFAETLVEIRMSVSMVQESQAGKQKKKKKKFGGMGGFAGIGVAGLMAGAVSASYANRYQYTAEGSSLLRTRIVPVPPPAVFEERIREMIAANKLLGDAGRP